jgi:glutamate synthase (NADPH/NADH) large chain
MTGGTVVVLGKAGRNFAAGMSGGVAYVLDTTGDFELRCNKAMVTLEPVLDVGDQPATIRHLGRADAELLRSLIEKHLFTTGSARARAILDDFASYRARFVKVMPHEYRRALGELEATTKAAIPVKAQNTAVLNG